MEAIFEFVQLTKSDRLEEFTQKKLEKLENKYNWIIRANIYFKHDENQKPNGYICEMRLSVPGPEIFAQSNEDSFESAVANTVKDLDRQCAKKKDKMTSHH